MILPFVKYFSSFLKFNHISVFTQNKINTIFIQSFVYDIRINLICNRPNWKQLMCLLTDEWLNKCTSMYNHVHPYTTLTLQP